VRGNNVSPAGVVLRLDILGDFRCELASQKQGGARERGWWKGGVQ
jgi:hypothetical protein